VRVSGWSVLALAAAFLQSAAQAQNQLAAPPVDESLIRYASTKDNVRLADGRELHFVCMGQGSPTVILTAGLGDDASAWGTVQPAMAKMTRVCAWDRPGFALSDGSAQEQTVRTTAADLEAALAASGTIKGPYVLVSHSLGSYETLLFADHNPGAVAGMLLIDPSFPDQTAVAQKLLPGSMAADTKRRTDAIALLRKCAAALRSRTIRPGGADPDHCFAYPPFFPPALRAALDAKITNPVQYETLASFMANADGAGSLVVNADRNYGDKPMIVLTATKVNSFPGITDVQKAEQAAFAVEWNRAHDALAALSSRGVNARVPGAGHYIHRDKPQVVLDALAAVIAEARASKIGSSAEHATGAGTN
jgi:pimeloyl-ACP methyl ester carboxylesterase